MASKLKLKAIKSAQKALREVHVYNVEITAQKLVEELDTGVATIMNNRQYTSEEKFKFIQSEVANLASKISTFCGSVTKAENTKISEARDWLEALEEAENG